MRLVVIGGVAAGMSAASRARRADRSLEITVLEKGEWISYGACGLPYFLEGRVRNLQELVTYTPEYFRRERQIDVRTAAEVTRIAHARREVTLASGDSLRYDRLVVATGTRAIRDLPGAGQPHVFTIHDPGDAGRLRAFLVERRPRRAVVVGAGPLGLEAADVLRRKGLRVSVIHAGEQVLGRDDPALTAEVHRQLERFHVECRPSTPVTAIEPTRVGGVPCDLVVLALGVRPNVELAAEAGVRLGRSGAIALDHHMETNLAGLYAAGDCAEVTHLVTGRNVYLPLGTTANKMGRVAGANAAGRRERFPGVVGTSILSLFELGIAWTGLSEVQARRDGFSAVAVTVEARSRPRYFRGKSSSVTLVAERGSGRLLGGAVVGEQDTAGRINVVASAITARMALDDFQHLDLAYAPPFATVWDPLLIAAQQLVKLV